MITFQNLGRYGRLGNQMFQYATLYSIAKHNGYRYGIPVSRNRNSYDQYQDLSLVDCFPKLTCEDCSNYASQYGIMETSNNFDASVFNAKDGSDILGYFQSEKYFIKYKENLLKEFEFKEYFYQRALAVKNKFDTELVSIHMRFGDYCKLNHMYTNANIEYYKNAISLMPKETTLILFSDDLNKAQQLLNQLNATYYVFKDFNAYEDLCLMSMCDYHVIANSSFSWWGSWLSASKKTIAPRKWYTGNIGSPASWNDIYCSKWIIV